MVVANIISPIAGVVTTPKTSELVGQLVEKGDLIVEVHQNKQVIAEIIVSEKDIADIEIDDNVVLKARAYPDREFTGKVTAIAPKMDESRVLGEKVIRVTTEIENNNLWLKTEMTGQGKIYCGERTIINIMSRRLKRFFKVEFWSWW